MMSDQEKESLDQIWAGDLLNRKAEAGLVIDYIESVAQRSDSREDVRAFTLAVDVGYGEGKTFFLRRLARQLEIKHPVAFIDAWADDTANEPLTALAATLKRALDPLQSKPSVKEKTSVVLSKVGALTKVIAIGAAKRAAAAVITEGAVGAVAAILGNAPESLKEAGAAAATVGDDAVDAAVSTFKGRAPEGIMLERIADFEAGKAAIVELKESLSALMGALKAEGSAPPIVIIIDELDRCRPTYAIKLLEEIKHLFDVPGLVFVFGMHGEQLAHAVSSAYGAGFDGNAYLRRFIRRRYKLKEPDLQPLLSKLVAEAPLISKRVNPYFEVGVGSGGEGKKSIDELLALYMKIYALPVREAFHVVDVLETCVALADGQTLFAPYLLPMIMSRVMRADGHKIREPSAVNLGWYFIARDQKTGQRQEVAPWTMASKLAKYFTMSRAEFMKRSNAHSDVFAEIAYHVRGNASGLGSPENYGALLDSVGRFTRLQ